MHRIATGFGLIEAPVWQADKGLYFSDALNGGVHLLDRQDVVSMVFPKRRGIGGMVLHENGGLVVGGRDVAYFDFSGAASRTLLAPDLVPDAVGFNDFTADRAGRLYVGSVAFRVFGAEAPRPGRLTLVELDGSSRSISDGVMLTNGMGFSPDGRKLYHSDAGSGLVRMYDVMDDGSVGPWRPFAVLGPHGVPDGLKVASDGSVWVANAHGGCVKVFNADGSHRLDLPVPLPMVTSLCFGGDDMRELYVVTGSQGGPAEICGSIFRTTVDVPGLPVPPARVAIPEPSNRPN